jgi:hypothetical protein
MGVGCVVTDDDGGDARPDKGRRRRLCTSSTAGGKGLCKANRSRKPDAQCGRRGSGAAAAAAAAAETPFDGVGWDQRRCWSGLVGDRESAPSGGSQSQSQSRAFFCCRDAVRCDAVRCERDAVPVPAGSSSSRADEIGDMLGVGLNVLQDHGAESGVGWF